MQPDAEHPHGPPALASGLEPLQGLDMPEIILLIDDDAALLAALRDALTTDSSAPVLARRASDAVQELDRGMQPDAVVIDLDMPDGLIALEQVHSATEHTVPVVALSSSPRRLLEAALADEVLLKPFEAGHLRTCITRACGCHHGAL